VRVRKPEANSNMAAARITSARRSQWDAAAPERSDGGQTPEQVETAHSVILLALHDGAAAGPTRSWSGLLTMTGQ
jgi:hypothetical protein